jgi:Na+-transporting NADH:ubiquinone oxidoreductase subunit NqrC
MNGKIKKIVVIILSISLLIGIISTYYLFKLDQDIQNFYERKNSLDIAYVKFVGQDTITRINP